jgi:hypothetical protein
MKTKPAAAAAPKIAVTNERQRFVVMLRRMDPRNAYSAVIAYVAEEIFHQTKKQNS